MNFNRVGLILSFILTVLFSANLVDAGTLPGKNVISISSPINFSVKQAGNFNDVARNYFKTSNDYSWEIISIETDKNSTSHKRYQQFYNGLKVENAVLILHAAKKLKSTFHGVFVKVENSVGRELISPEMASRNFRILDPISIKSCELLWVWNDHESNYTLQYRIEFNSENNLELNVAYVDAYNGKSLSTHAHICNADVPGITHTSYHGTQNIMTSLSQGNYKLVSTSRGQGIETRNLNQQLNYNSVSDFTDSDNNWEQTVNANEKYATDAHFAAEKYYDFLSAKFNRNSIDNNGQKLISYLNYGTGLRNAFWNGNAVVYGNGNASGGPLTTLDITGHEFTHGLIQKTANLNYSGEPGTLNEAIADILGTALEHFASPQNADWLIGEKSGAALRSISNPELYNQPSTYLGNFWYSGTGDNGGVHMNSGFINKWFYLLTVGGQGTNDNGVNYAVQGITLQKSTELVYHSLTAYSLPSTGFKDFMNFTLQSAIDLYGVCSPEYLSVLNAWKAVGLSNYTTEPVSIASESGNSFCENDSTLITANGLPGSIFTWYCNGIMIASNNFNSIYAKAQGFYTVTESRCGILISSSPIQLIEVSLPLVSTAAVSVCEGEQAILSGFPAGGTFSVANPYSGPSTPFTYTFTNSYGCKSSATALISVNAKPIVNILNTTTTFPQNSGPVSLLGNVSGIYSGSGVVGNYFNPESLQPNNIYSVYLQYTNSSGCSSKDSILFAVTKPCRRDHANLEVIESSSIIYEVPVSVINVNASTDDYIIDWILPSSLNIISNNSDSSIAVSTPLVDCLIKVRLTNTCGESIERTKIIHAAKKQPAFIFSMHPNPAKENIIVETNISGEEFIIKISDSKGSMLRMFLIKNQSEIVNLSGLSKGVYFVEIFNTKHYSNKKLVIN